MGTIVDNKISEILLTSVETVQLSTSYICPSTSDSEEIQSDTHSTDVEQESNSKASSNQENTDTVVCTEITVETIGEINQNDEANEKNTITTNEISLAKENTTKKSLFSSIIDSDSDDDEIDESNNQKVFQSKLQGHDYKKNANKKSNARLNNFDSSDEEDLPPRKKAKSKTEEQLEPRKILTGREAAEQKREIISESQRMLRESRVSLPYHKPKPRSIKEFMASRPKISDSLPCNVKMMPTINAIKITSKLPDEVVKKIEERTKKAEKFYQVSDSSDDETISVEETKIKELQTVESNNRNEENVEIISNDHLSIITSNRSLKQIMYECTSNIEQLKNDLIKSFLNPSNLKNDTFEEQDLDTELISEIEVSKIIDTLGNEEMAKNSDFKETEIRKTKENINKYETTSKFMNTSKWAEGKCFDALSDSEDTVPIDDVAQQIDPLFRTDIQPTLRGNPNEIIDLDDDFDREIEDEGVNGLLNRFIKHTTKKSFDKNKAETGLIITEIGNDDEKLSMNLSKAEEKTAYVAERPGAKMQRLREDLKKKIVIQRSEEWAKRQQETKQNMLDDEEKDFEDFYEDEKSQCGTDTENNNNNEDEDEVENKNCDNLETDDDLEDEDEIEDEEEIKGDNSNKKPKSLFIDDEADETDLEEDEDEESDTEEVEIRDKKKKKSRILRRIKTMECDDSDSDSSILNDEKLSKSQKLNSEPKTTNNNYNSDSDSEFPLGQPDLSTPKKVTDVSKIIDSDLKDSDSFLSPVQKLAASQNTSLDCEVSEGPVKLPTVTSDPSPLQEIPNKLCFETEVLDTQENMDELLNLCSGTFTNAANSEQPNHNSDHEFTLSLPSQLKNVDFKNEKSIESDLESLLSESDTKVTTSRIIDSSDEEIIEDKKTSTKKKPVKMKLQFSEDESEDESETENETETEPSTKKVINYDSEENEIFEEDDEEEKNVRPSDFFEAEAELSDEENFDSADENEEDLDVMEREEGDDEKLNHRKVQRELERIHMKHVLEKDKHDVRLIQEILLEDGDLHSDKGRQRKFRWKNDMTFESNDQGEADNEEEVVDLDDAEAEQQYRRMRYEREKFLREKEKSESLIDDSLIKLNNGAQTFKIVSECTRKSEISLSSTSSPIITNSKEESISLNFKSSILGVTNKRGSFLSRGQAELNRIAAFTKDITVGGVKNSNNFVFSSVDSSKCPKTNKSKDSSSSVSTVSFTKNSNKRKGSETMPSILKKLCMSDKTSKNSS